MGSGALLGVLILQFVLRVTDRQAAEAVQYDLRWRVALHLSAQDAACDPSVLVVFRNRLLEGAQETRAQPTGAVHNPHEPEAQWSSKSTTKDKTWVDDANSRFKLKDPAKTGRALYKHLWRADIAPRPAVGRSWRQAAGAL